MNNDKIKFINYVIAFLVLIFLAGYSITLYKESQAFGHAFSCGIFITASAFFAKEIVKMIFSKQRTEKKDYDFKRKNSKKLLEKLKNLLSGKD